LPSSAFFWLLLSHTQTQRGRNQRIVAPRRLFSSSTV
jgi:hypothetical protein